MENQPTSQDSNSLDNFFNISFDTSMRSHIRQAAVWARVGAVCGFGVCAIALIVAFFGRVDPLSESETGFQISASTQAGRILGSLITVAIGVFINYFLYRYAQLTIRGIDAMDNVETNNGFDHLRKYFRILGIMMIIALSLIALGVLIVIGVGISRL